jgi:putative protease
MPVFENDRGTYIFNSKDLCMIEYIPELVSAGIDSLKIEGRMKTALYVATVARTYRKAIDDFYESVDKYRENMEYYKAEIGKCTYGQFTTGFFFQKPDSNTQIYDNNVYVKEFTYLGIVSSRNAEGASEMEQRNKFSVGDMVEIMKPNGDNISTKVLRITDEKGNEMESCPHPQQKIFVTFDKETAQYDIIRVQEKSDNSKKDCGCTSCQ